MGMEEIRKRLMTDPSKYDQTLMQAEAKGREYGHIPGFPIGSKFAKRSEMVMHGIHRNNEAGICGSSTTGATSVVVSGKYEDDQDFGERLIYTGTGGRGDVRMGDELWSDQSMTHRHNSMLKTSINTKYPVRVIRGADSKSKYAPWDGYRYDGLYQVLSAKEVPGKSGFKVCRFEMLRLGGQPPIPEKQLGKGQYREYITPSTAEHSWTTSLSLSGTRTNVADGKGSSDKVPAALPMKPPHKLNRKAGLKRSRSENEFSESDSNVTKKAKVPAPPQVPPSVPSDNATSLPVSGTTTDRRLTKKRRQRK